MRKLIRMVGTVGKKFTDMEEFPYPIVNEDNDFIYFVIPGQREAKIHKKNLNMGKIKEKEDVITATIYYETMNRTMAFNQLRYMLKKYIIDQYSLAVARSDSFDKFPLFLTEEGN